MYPDHSPTLQCPNLVRRTVYSYEAKVFLSIQRSREGDSSESTFILVQSNLIKITMKTEATRNCQKVQEDHRESWGQGGWQRLSDDGSQSRTQGQVRQERGKFMVGVSGKINRIHLLLFG